MLKINLEGFKAYAQHFQFIFSCASLLHAQHKCFHNSCVPEVLTQHKYKHSCAPNILSQHKHQILMCSKAPHSTKNISSIMCFRVHAQHMKSYIKHMQLSYSQYIKQIIMFMCSGALDPKYQLKHQSNITSNGFYAHTC